MHEPLWLDNVISTKLPRDTLIVRCMAFRWNVPLVSREIVWVKSRCALVFQKLSFLGLQKSTGPRISFIDYYMYMYLITNLFAFL